MTELVTARCKHCGNDIAVWNKSSPLPEYHKNCAWYEIPCQICGKPMAIHRDWEHPPKAHKECKDSQRAQFYEKACEYCGEPLRVRVNAVNVPSSPDVWMIYANVRTVRVVENFKPLVIRINDLDGQRPSSTTRSAISPKTRRSSIS
jgi:hypothetical protein